MLHLLPGRQLLSTAVSTGLANVVAYSFRQRLQGFRLCGDGPRQREGRLPSHGEVRFTLDVMRNSALPIRSIAYNELWRLSCQAS
jgi:hypothetical protein